MTDRVELGKLEQASSSWDPGWIEMRTTGEWHGVKMASSVPVSRDLLEDSAIDITAWLRRMALDAMELLLLKEVTAEGLLTCLSEPHDWLETQGGTVCLRCGTGQDAITIFRSGPRPYVERLTPL